MRSSTRGKPGTSDDTLLVSPGKQHAFPGSDDARAKAKHEKEEHYHDDLTGEPLPPKAVHAARQEELVFMWNWKVWDVVPIAECRQKTGRAPLGGRWVDVNKGDRANPDIR